MIFEYLEKYKEITYRIIDEIEGDSDVTCLMDERGKIISKIFSCKDKKLIKDIYLQLELDKLDLRFGEKIKQEQVKIKKQIERLNQQKSASRGYNNALRQKNFFSTKI